MTCHLGVQFWSGFGTLLMEMEDLYCCTLYGSKWRINFQYRHHSTVVDYKKIRALTLASDANLDLFTADGDAINMVE